MSFAYLALYTGDYLRDTRHLTPLKHGVYLLLLMHCWDSRGPVPLDEQECAGIANCRSSDEIDALRYVLQKYFTCMDDGWYNARMQAEIERAQAISAARAHAGFKGYQAKAKQLLSKSLASATTPPPPPSPPPSPPPRVSSLSDSQPQTPLSGKPDVAPRNSKAPYVNDAKSALEYLNKATGKGFELRNRNGELTASADKIIQRLKQGYTVTELREVVYMKAQQWGNDEKMSEYLRPSTLFSKEKFEQYIGELRGVKNG